MRHIAAFFIALVATAMTAHAAPTAVDGGDGVGTPAATQESPYIPAATVSSTYTLSPYDVIDVTVYNEDDLHTRARLGADGTALLPLIGTVSLSGKTVSEANEIIQDSYAKGFVKDPHVLVTVIDYRKATFSILGQVNRAGIYEIPEGTHLSIVDAVLLAGGFTRLANTNDVRVKRLVKGKAVVFKVHAGEMADSPEIPPFDILPGDVINVKESWF